MNWLKDKLTSVFGTFGFILYYAVNIIFSFAPLFVLPFPIFVVFLLFLAMNILPYIGTVINVVLWLWALIVTINAPQDVFSVIYYVLFAANCVRIMLCFLPLFSKKIVSTQKKISSIFQKCHSAPSSQSDMHDRLLVLCEQKIKSFDPPPHIAFSAVWPQICEKIEKSREAGEILHENNLECTCLSLIYDTCYDLLFYGTFHFYRGALTPQGDCVYTLLNKTTKEAVMAGFADESLIKHNDDVLLEQISSIG